MLGREFDVTLLGRIAEVSDVDTLGRLDEAVRAHVLDAVEGVPGRYRFHHSLIRQTLYDELNTPERIRLHAQIGAALAAAHGADLDPIVDELAHHFFQAAPAGESERAIDYCLRAAERAHRLLAYEQSAGSTSAPCSCSSCTVRRTRCDALSCSSESGRRRRWRAPAPGRASTSRVPPRSRASSGARTCWRGCARLPRAGRDGNAGGTCRTRHARGRVARCWRRTVVAAPRGCSVAWSVRRPTRIRSQAATR